MQMQIEPSFRRQLLSPEASALRDRVRRFIADEIDAGRIIPGRQSWTSFDREFSLRCGEQGYIAMTWPRQYGGHEKPAWARYVVIEELLAGGAPLGSHWIADRQSGPQILRHGSDRLRHEILPQIAAGRCCFGIGMSEPEAGSDLSAIRTKAEQVTGGWRLNGRKIWTTNGQLAEYMIVLCRTSPRSDDRYAGMSQLVVPMTSTGVAVRPITTMVGEPEFAEVTFDDVFIPDDQLLGTPGAGWSLVMEELAHERSGPDRFLSTFSLLSLMVAQTQGAMADQQLGGLIGRLMAVRALSVSISGRLGRGEGVSADAAIMKEAGTRLEQQIPETARHVSKTTPISGAAGLSGALAAARLSAPCFSLRGGTREILKGIIAREIGLR